MGNALGINRLRKQNPIISVRNENDDGDTDNEKPNNSDEENVTLEDDNNADLNHERGIEEARPRTPNPSPAVSWGTPSEERPSLEILTLKSQQVLSLIDPRSPNQDISRTPIVVGNENVNGRKKPATNYLKVNQTLNQLELDGEGDSEYTTPEPSTTSALAFDPRSPTHEFDRTPIGVLQKEPIRNKASKLEGNRPPQRRLQEN